MGRPYQKKRWCGLNADSWAAGSDGGELLWVVPRAYVFTRSPGAPLYTKSDLCRKQFPGAPLLKIKENPFKNTDSYAFNYFLL